MELSITYNYIHIGQTCRLHTTTLRSDMSIVYKKSQRISNNIISCHHIVNLYYPREVCCILPSHDVVTFSCILLFSLLSLDHTHCHVTVTLHILHYAFLDCHMPYLHCAIFDLLLLYLHCGVLNCRMPYLHSAILYGHKL